MRPLLAVLAASLASTACTAHAGGLRAAAGPYRLEVLVDGSPARTFDHRGETWVLGQLSDRYTLRVINHSAQRVEAVVTIDGRDVIDGGPGDFRQKSGYLVPAWGSIDIDGWRVSRSEAAAFRFSSVADSYAARTGGGREVGVIGVAVFPERRVPRPRRPVAAPWWSGRSGPAHDRGADGESFDDSPSGSPREERAPAGKMAPPAASESGSSADARAAAPTHRPGLGTEFGEAVASEVQEVPFQRASPSSPAAVLGARYNDRAGLLARGIRLDPPPWVASDADERGSADPFPGHDRGYARPPVGWRR